MAKKMTRDDFIAFSHSNRVIAESEISFQPSVEYVMVLFAQACLESGEFTSNKYTKDGNMFGLQAAQIRKKLYVSSYSVTTGSEKGKWPEYRDQAQSFTDRLNWDVYNRIQYVHCMQYMKQVQGNNDNGLTYAQDPQYIAKWIGWINKVADDAGMVRFYIEGFTDYSENGNPGEIKPGSSNDTGKTVPDSKKWYEGLGWQLWAGIAAVAALAIYLVFKRD